MAAFEINEDYRLKSDSRQWSLQRRSVDSKTGETNWTSIRYYSTIQGSVTASYGYFQRQIEADNITEFMAKSNSLLVDFSNIFSPQLTVTASK